MTAFDEIRDALRTHTGGSAPITETAEYREALRTRVRKLRADGVSYPEATAREQLLREARERTETAQRRAVHDAMTAQTERENQGEGEKWAKRANAPLLSRTPQPGDPYVIADEGRSPQSRDRVSERLMAQYHGYRASA
ncbi:hypothetical protein ACQEV4_40200 [Streptomyces shenzhenensis]|uniref:hypothetical protein n=1 Tax=Streptomyces shenzhenensis TaxID=943815 RepID=UPI003D8DDF82